MLERIATADISKNTVTGAARAGDGADRVGATQLSLHMAAAG